MRQLAVEAAIALPAPEAKRCLSFITIELLNTWGSFGRCYILSCVLGARRVNGGRVALGLSISDFNDALAVAMKRHKSFAKRKSDGSWNRRDEPAWFDPQVLDTVCADLKCSHHAHVQNALSIPTRVFTDLPVFRNFFAHRNRGSAAAARATAPQYLIPSHLHPVEILSRRPSKRPHPLIVDWIDDITATVELLTE